MGRAPKREFIAFIVRPSLGQGADTVRTSVTTLLDHAANIHQPNTTNPRHCHRDSPFTEATFTFNEDQ